MIALMLACMACSTAFPDDTNPAVTKELDKLQGTWAIVSIEDQRGKFAIMDAPPGTDFSGFTMTIRGTTLTIGTGDDASTARLTLDPSTSPKLIDIVYAKPEFTLETIYEVDNDVLRIAFRRGRGDGAKNRPTSFSVKDNPDYEIRTYKREK